jgi:hypothetical protein
MLSITYQQTNAEDMNDDTVSYSWTGIDEELWRSWTNTIPRAQPIHARLETLIEHDLKSATREATDEPMNDKTLGIFATRIRIRAMQAVGAVRDGDEVDEETALEQLDEIIEMADVLEG